MNDAPKKRGPKPKTDLPKEIRDNIVESNLPDHVLEAIEDAVAQDVEQSDKPKAYAGKCPVTGKDVWL